MPASSSPCPVVACYPQDVKVLLLSVHPLLHLNNEVVCPFLSVSGSLTRSIGIPESPERDWSQVRASPGTIEHQSNSAHTHHAFSVREPICSPQTLE